MDPRGIQRLTTSCMKMGFEELRIRVSRMRMLVGCRYGRAHVLYSGYTASNYISVSYNEEQTLV